MPTSMRFPLSAAIAIGCLALGSTNVFAASSGVIAAIEKKYTVAELDANHDQVTKDGTKMALKCAGIYSLPASMMMSTPPDNKVVDGKVVAPNTFSKYALAKLGAHVMQTGDNVYITKIDTKSEPGDDLLRFTIISVDALDVTGQDAKKKFNAIVSFKFKKGYLDDTPPDEVEAAIENVLAPDTGSDDSKGGNSTDSAQAPAKPQAAPAPAAPRAAAPAPAPAPAAPAPAPAAPPTISVGESSTQVLQALGMPQQMIDLGKKKIFVYKNLNMKITFVDDKVSDVQ